MLLPNALNLRRAAGTPSFVYQCLPGKPSVEAREACLVIDEWLTANGIITKTFGAEPAAGQEHFLIQDLPHHGDFVLILHDSGNESADEFICIANLAAPVILLHYTVSESPSGSPARWAMATAALGMDQIATLRLRGTNFHDAASLLFPAINLAPAVVRDADAFFSVVVPGDLTSESDAQIVTCAFARMREAVARPSKLTFMGRTLDAGIAKSVQDEIRNHCLQDVVTITGALDQAAEAEIFADSDLCVLLAKSKIIPECVIQAANLGLPILARPAPAVTQLFGDAGLSENTSPTIEQLAERLIDFAIHPRSLRALQTAQQRHLTETGSNKRFAETLWNAFGRCGLALPMSSVERQNVSAQLGFVVAGHFEGSYSIAAVNRLLAMALESKRPGSVSVVPVAFLQPLISLEAIPSQESEILEELFVRKRPSGMPVIAISQHFPPWKPDFPNDLALSLFTWEETLIPAPIVEMLNTSFDGVMAVSRFVAKTLIDSGVKLPVGVVGQSLAVAPFAAVAKERLVEGRVSAAAPFTVLHVSSCFPRKGPDLLLAAWAGAFTSEDSVRLIIKTFPNPHHQIAQDLENLRAEFPNIAPVELIEGDLEQTELTALYRAADCMLLPTRGEGFNMVAAEAVISGLPLIVTDFGGHLDFLENADVRRVGFRFEKSASHVAGGGALWAEPDLDDLIAALREVFSAQQAGRVFKPAGEFSTAREAQFSAARWADQVANFATGLILDGPTRLTRLVWISSWAVRCGVAEYSKALLKSRSSSVSSTEILLLCDTRTSDTIDMQTLESIEVKPVWRLGERRIAAQVETHLRHFDPQLILIQHQDGLISWEDLLDMIYLARTANRRLVVVLHSTEAILSLHHKLRASVLFGLSLVERVVVHTLHDIENLRRLALTDNVTHLPHGAAPLMAARHANPGSGTIIGCYGFFLPHKGIAKLIEAFSVLRSDWPLARLRLVNAAFPSDVSTSEIKSCYALARRLQVDDGIDWHTQYLDEMASKTLLAECSLIVLPYDQTPESVSGAVRHALASGRPVAVSHSAIFNELGNAVHHIDAGDADRLAKSLSILLNDPASCESTLDAAAAWLGEHDWQKIAKRLFHMIEGLSKATVDHSASRLILPASHGLLETEIGERGSRTIIFSGGASGFGIYGPYVNLIAGQYKIIYRFDQSVELTGTACFEVYSQITGVSIECRDRTFAAVTPDQYTTELAFTLSQTVLEVECRMHCEAGFRGAFESLSIQLLHTP